MGFLEKIRGEDTVIIAAGVFAAAYFLVPQVKNGIDNAIRSLHLPFVSSKYGYAYATYYDDMEDYDEE